MAKYILGESIGITYNASSKARDDINYFAEKFGYVMIANNDKRRSKNRIEKIIATSKSLIHLLLKIKKDDLLLAQVSLRVLPMLGYIKKIKKFKLIYLIHDLDEVRDNYNNTEAVNREIQKLNYADYIVAHNELMKNFLISKGVLKNIVSLEIFDYVYNDTNNIQIQQKSSLNYTIAFAGNLSPDKTGFIQKLDKLEFNYNVNLYGNTEQKFIRLNYCGKFKPEELPRKMVGDFGLVWEGNDLYVDQTTHPYIMLNNPHKVSLYIVSGLPIIIWEKAALSEFIRKNKIGIVIDDLASLSSVLANITENDYKIMKSNIYKIRGSLLKGEHLKIVLNKIEKDYENKR